MTLKVKLIGDGTGRVFIGFVLDKKDPDLLRLIIAKAFHSDIAALGTAASRRVTENFGLGRRRSELLALILKI